MDTVEEFEISDWLLSFFAAENEEWQTDNLADPRARWMGGTLLKSTKVRGNPEIIEAALKAIEATENPVARVSPDRLLRVVESYRGETGTDFKELAHDYAEHDFIGPDEDNPHPDWDGFEDEEDYEKWYTEHAINDGDVCAETAQGGTLYWFDRDEW